MQDVVDSRTACGAFLHQHVLMAMPMVLCWLLAVLGVTCSSPQVCTFFVLFTDVLFLKEPLVQLAPQEQLELQGLLELLILQGPLELLALQEPLTLQQPVPQPVVIQSLQVPPPDCSAFSKCKERSHCNH